MALFIDPPVWPAHGRLWSHLVSDASFEELHQFAAAHSVPRRGFERDHYDVPARAYDPLVAAGATPVSSREVVRRLTAAGLRRRKSGAPAPRPAGRGLLRTPRLRNGDLVAVVSPAGPVEAVQLAAGVSLLESWGLRVSLGDHVLGRHERLAYLAGTDAERAADFSAAWLHPQVRAVFAARGGFGSGRVVPLLDWHRLAEAEPKALVGFSDITVLHQALAARLGLVSVLSHVVSSLVEATQGSAERLRRLLFSPDQELDLLQGTSGAVEAWAPGRTDGILLGGNLALLTAGVGTCFTHPARGAIVVLEDIAEVPRRIDRQLTQLTDSGWFDGVRGIVLGAFTDCGDARDVDAVLRERLLPFGIPVLAGVDVGHTPGTISIPLGVSATLDADAGSLVLNHSALS